VPPPNFVGQDTITFTAFDSFGNSTTGTVVIVVINVLAGPAAPPSVVPLVQWTPIVTNQFSASGGFSYTNVIQPNLPAQYFHVILP
jgi:hypothetical protein